MTPSKDNPYFKRRKTQTKSGPLILQVPEHYFTGGAEMEKELLPSEFCLAHIPNSAKTGYEFHTALVVKNSIGDVFSTTMFPHHALLKDTKENTDALQNNTQTSIPEKGHKQKSGKNGKNKKRKSKKSFKTKG